MKDDTLLPYILYPNGRNAVGNYNLLNVPFLLRLLCTFDAHLHILFCSKVSWWQFVSTSPRQCEPKAFVLSRVQTCPFHPKSTPSKEPMGMALVWFDVPVSPCCSSKAIKEWQPFFHSTSRGGLEPNCFFSRGSRPGIRVGTFQTCAEHQCCLEGCCPYCIKIGCWPLKFTPGDCDSHA